MTDDDKKEINSLPSLEKRNRLYTMAVICDGDIDILRDIFICQRLPDEEIREKVRKMRENTRKTFMQDYNYQVWW